MKNILYVESRQKNIMTFEKGKKTKQKDNFYPFIKQFTFFYKNHRNVPLWTKIRSLCFDGNLWFIPHPLKIASFFRPQF